MCLHIKHSSTAVCNVNNGWLSVALRLTLDASAAHPQTAGVRLQRRLTGKLVSRQIAKNTSRHVRACLRSSITHISTGTHLTLKINNLSPLLQLINHANIFTNALKDYFHSVSLYLLPLKLPNSFII